MSDSTGGTSPAGASARARGLHRLVDMLVEEVSLVDRPANKRRFLIVKRDSDMANDKDKKPASRTPAKRHGPKKTAGDSAPVPATEAAEKAKKTPPSKQPEDEGAGDADALDEENGAGDETDSPPAKAPPSKAPSKAPPRKTRKEEEVVPPVAPSSELLEDEGEDDEDSEEEENQDDDTPLSVALAALDSLTQAVEILSASPDDTSPLASVAEDVRAAAETIALAAGLTPTSTEEREAASTDRLVSSIEALLERVDGLTQTLAAKAEVPPPAAAAQPSGERAPDLAGPLADVAQAVKSLEGTVRAQAARIDAMEKRAGVPNSEASGERVAKSEPEDLSWPVDMNRPRDRASVDRSISFHD